MKKWIAGIVVYLGCATVNYGGSLAYWQHKFPELAAENCREDVGLALTLSLIPPGWVAGVTTTGFYEYGFQFTCKWQRNG